VGEPEAGELRPGPLRQVPAVGADPLVVGRNGAARQYALERIEPLAHAEPVGHRLRIIGQAAAPALPDVRQTAVPGHGPGRRCPCAHEEVEQERLADAVSADESRALVRAREREAVEEPTAVGKDQAEPVGR
jgi:hypothetical protein